MAEFMAELQASSYHVRCASVKLKYKARQDSSAIEANMYNNQEIEHHAGVEAITKSFGGDQSAQ
jgi:hypothetical protein